MHLYAISRISDLLVLDILKRQQKYSGNLVVLVFDNEIVKKLEQYGIHSQLVSPKNSGVDYHDKYLGDKSSISGDLDGMPLWKMLGIDRLNFWYDPRTIEIVSALDFESLTISLDIYDTLVWQIASIAKGRKVLVRAIQTHSVRTREMYDLLPASPIDELIVSFPADDLYNSAAVINSGARPRVAKQSEELRDETAVIFDKRDEYQFRRLLSTVKTGKFVVFPSDNRSEELYLRYLHKHIGVPIYDDITLLRQFRQVVAFRFDDDLIYKFIPEETKTLIYDFGGVNLASKLVRESDKNVETLL